jgi:hypothetical protein
MAIRPEKYNDHSSQHLKQTTFTTRQIRTSATKQYLRILHDGKRDRWNKLRLDDFDTRIERFRRRHKQLSVLKHHVLRIDFNRICRFFDSQSSVDRGPFPANFFFELCSLLTLSHQWPILDGEPRTALRQVI